MNTIELPVSELKTALTGLNKIINKNTCLPALKSIRVARISSGQVTLEATDLDACAEYKTVAQPGPACQFLVPFEPLSKAVRNSPASNRIALLQDSTSLTLRTFIGSNPVDQKLESLDLKEWPSLPSCNATSVPLTADLTQTLVSAMDCCSQDESRAAIRGAWLDVSDPKAHYIMATDGRHLFSANSFTLDLKNPVLVPDARFITWTGFANDGDWKLASQPDSKDESYALLKIESTHWTYQTRQRNETCPNWRHVVPAKDEARTRITFSTQAQSFLAELLPTLPGSDDINRTVVLETNGRTLTVKARAKDATEWTTAIVPEVQVSGAPVTIALNREYLLRALQFGLLDVDLGDVMTPAVFYQGGKRMVVMPIRMPAPEAKEAVNAAPAPEPHPTQPEPAPQKADSNITQNERKETMPQQPEPATTSESPVKTVVQQIEQIRETLKQTLQDFASIMQALRQAERQKRISDREVSEIREKLRLIQSVKI